MSTSRFLKHVCAKSAFNILKQKNLIPIVSFGCSNSRYYSINSISQSSNLLSSVSNRYGRNVNFPHFKNDVWSKAISNMDKWSVSNTKFTSNQAGKSETKSTAATADIDILGDTSKLGLFAKFKLMYKQYWYVLIPVHVVTSIGWFGAFYYLSKFGVDVPALLQHVHFSETIIGKVQDSKMGHFAIAYLCYKVITPLRYAVTLGGTTISIKYLVQAGHIKPMPTKNQIIKMYERKKADRLAAKADKEEKSKNKK